jgi:hypothetical protein
MGEGGLGNLIHNERIKLTATFYNNLAISAVVAGVIVPLFSRDEKVLEFQWLFMFGGFAMAAGLKAAAYVFLRHLKE